MLTYSVPSESIDIAKAFTAFESNLDRLHLDNYIITQPTLEQVFLEFTNPASEASHRTNEVEEAMQAAFDDEDVRLAEKSTPRCCFMDNTQTKKLFVYCFTLLFIFVPIAVFEAPVQMATPDGGGLTKFLSPLIGFDKHMLRSKSERRLEPYCPNQPKKGRGIPILGTYGLFARSKPLQTTDRPADDHAGSNAWSDRTSPNACTDPTSHAGSNALV